MVCLEEKAVFHERNQFLTKLTMNIQLGLIVFAMIYSRINVRQEFCDVLFP